MFRLYIFTLIILFLSTVNGSFLNLEYAENDNQDLVYELKQLLNKNSLTFNIIELKLSSNIEAIDIYHDPITFESNVLDNSSAEKAFQTDGEKIKTLISNSISFKVDHQDSIIKLCSSVIDVPDILLNFVDNKVIIDNQELHFVKKNHVPDVDNFLGSKWDGLFWRSEKKVEETVEIYDFILGRLLDSNKIYISIRSFRSIENNSKKYYYRLIQS